MSSTSSANQIVDVVLRRKPMHRRFLTASLAKLEPAERQHANAYIDFLLGDGQTVESLADAYLLIVDDTFRETMHFRQTGRYRYTSFAEARANVYDNHDYMQRYMLGLGLSTFWWFNHVRLRRFFNQQLPTLVALGGAYREVGPGHGIYFIDALRTGGFAEYEGVDISATSIGLTKRMLANPAWGNLSPAKLKQADFLTAGDLRPSDVLVMGEVLEHVEDPGAFLARAYETTTQKARVFLTTCLNAPAVDHLYNPPSLVALEALFNAHGFVIAARCELGQDDRSLQECERERLTINVGYVLIKGGRAS